MLAQIDLLPAREIHLPLTVSVKTMDVVSVSTFIVKLKPLSKQCSEY